MIRKSTPFILAVTQCELEDDIHVFTASIKEKFIDEGFDKVICGTTLIGGKMEAIIRDIRENMCTELWVHIDELCKRIIIGDEDTPSFMVNQQSRLTENLISWLTWAWENLKLAAFVGKELASGLYDYVMVPRDTSMQERAEPLEITSDTHVSLSPLPYDINQKLHHDHHRPTVLPSHNNLQRSDTG